MKEAEQAHPQVTGTEHPGSGFLATDLPDRGSNSKRDLVLLVGFAPQASEEFSKLVGRDRIALEVDSLGDAVHALEGREFSVVCMGERLSGLEVEDLLVAIDRSVAVPPAVLICGADGCEAIPRDLLERDHIQVAGKVQSAGKALRNLVESALVEVRLRRLAAGGTPSTAGSAQDHDKRALIELAQRASSQDDRCSAARLIQAELPAILNADRAHCVFRSGVPGQFITWDESMNRARLVPVGSGLVGVVSATSQCLVVPRLAADSRFVAAVDDPKSNGSEALVCAPICAGTKEVLAVLIVVRASPAFDAFEVGALVLLADLLGSTFLQLDVVWKDVSSNCPETTEVVGIGLPLFREEATLAIDAGAPRQLRLQNSTPNWVRRSYWPLVLTIVAGLVIAMGVPIREYVSADATVQVLGSPGQSKPVVVAAFPANLHPYLKVGMSLRFKFDGEPHGSRRLVVGRVIDRDFGSKTGPRPFGNGLQDYVEVEEPTVLVEAYVDARESRADQDGSSYLAGKKAKLSWQFEVRS